MTAYLRYYFAMDGKKKYMDSLPMPKHFVKWYEPGDLIELVNKFDTSKMDSPLLAMFGEWRVKEGIFPQD